MGLSKAGEACDNFMPEERVNWDGEKFILAVQDK